MRVFTGVSLLCWLLAWLGLAGGQDSTLIHETDSYRVDVRLVQVDAQVISKKTHQVAGSLEQHDLRVYEDGVQQQISTFSQDELPLSVVLLVDLTDSVRPVLQALSQGAQQALQHLKPQDEVAVMVYSASTYLLQSFTTDRSLAAAAIDKAAHLGSPEAAFFNEAVFQAGWYLSAAKNPDSRRVILWFTDNVPNTPSPALKARAGRSLSGKDCIRRNRRWSNSFELGPLCAPCSREACFPISMRWATIRKWLLTGGCTPREMSTNTLELLAAWWWSRAAKPCPPSSLS
jgi:hypothetical protein